MPTRPRRRNPRPRTKHPEIGRARCVQRGPGQTRKCVWRSGLRQSLTPEIAASFARIALGHVTREYPNKLDHVLGAAGDARPPSALHPVFYGSFDWHSCVHGYWLLARLLQRFPAAPFANAITELFDGQLTPRKIAGECAYLSAPTSRGFERPYGWSWLLKLAA